MGIDDIPSQIGRVVRFSVRSKSSFILSFITAAFVLGFAADLLYSFAYTRIYNVKDAYYGRPAWALILTAAFGIPLLAGLITAMRAWRDVRPFKPGKYGIAIAPFTVHSIDPDVLGTPSKMQGLQDVVAQFFDALRGPLAERLWYDDFAFRTLPPFVRVANERQAHERYASLSASLLFWGTVVQRAGQPLMLRINLTGDDTQLAFTGQMEPIQISAFFGYYILTTAGYSELTTGDPSLALRLFHDAIDFAHSVDEMTKSTTSSERVIAWREQAEMATSYLAAVKH